MFQVDEALRTALEQLQNTIDTTILIAAMTKHEFGFIDQTLAIVDRTVSTGKNIQAHNVVNLAA